jgi:hypothetical protein
MADLYSRSNSNLSPVEIARLNRVASAAMCGRPADCDAVLWAKWIRDGIDFIWHPAAPSAELLDNAMSNARAGYAHLSKR